MLIVANILMAISLIVEWVIWFKKRRNKKMQKGDGVLYTMEFDADTSENPNIGPAIVTKVISDTELDLMVFFQNGSFSKLNCAQGDPGVRGTWHPKP